MSLSRISRELKNKPAGTIAVVVASVTDDNRVADDVLPDKMTVAALRFTKTAKDRLAFPSF